MHHPDEGVLAAYLDDALPAPERKQVERHLERCADCRESVVAIGAIVGQRADVPVRSRRRFSGPALGLAAAAALAALLLVPPLARRQHADERAASSPEDRPQLVVVAPRDEELVDRADLKLVWRGIGGGRYRLYFLSADGAVLWTSESADTTVLVPGTKLVAGGSYLWYVDAVGDGIVASTLVHRVRVRP